MYTECYRELHVFPSLHLGSDYFHIYPSRSPDIKNNREFLLAINYDGYDFSPRTLSVMPLYFSTNKKWIQVN